RDALLLPARQLARRVFGPGNEADAIERPEGRLAALGLARPAIKQRQLDVLDRARPGQQVEPLEHEAEVAAAEQRALVAGQRLHLGPEEAEHARGRHVEAAEDVHRGRLAGTRWPHDRDEIAALDREVDALQGLERTRSLAEGLGDPFELDDRLTRHYSAAFTEVTTFMPALS